MDKNWGDTPIARLNYYYFFYFLIIKKSIPLNKKKSSVFHSGYYGVPRCLPRCSTVNINRKSKVPTLSDFHGVSREKNYTALRGTRTKKTMARMYLHVPQLITTALWDTNEHQTKKNNDALSGRNNIVLVNHIMLLTDNFCYILY